MARQHPTPVDTARAIVLGEAVAALNKADGNGKRLRTTSVADYRAAIVAALAPVRSQQPSEEPLAVNDNDNVVDMWPTTRRGA